ncbi:Nramp family divalent metal transporter [Undibacterium sp. TJN19]|uniref:Nramp family divalent metal transporter n=1 Tax=Undibacterium sp. TJN19 TaxID=3413055 RepID=UPI003BF2D6BA
MPLEETVQVEAAATLADNDKKDSVLAKLGPGLITGAADDDPSGIATYSQAGAQFGFNMLWTILLTYPLMCGIQIVSARIGRVSGQGLATNIARHYPKWLLYFIVGSLLVANCINIGADLAAMGEASKLLLGGQAKWYAIIFGLISILLQVFIPYQHYVRVLKWLTLALLAYVATVFVVRIPWGQVVLSTIMPHISMKAEYLTMIVAVFGTTISPYLFFWQASQEVEELRAKPEETALLKAPLQAIRSLKRINIDTFIGMGFSNMVAFFIMLTTAVTLHMHGQTDIQSSAQAAAALKPIAGEFAFLLFSLGIIGTGLLAIPVLAGSSAYAIAGSFKWKNSLEHTATQAKEFYAVIAVSTVIGVILSLSNIDPIKALFWSAVINGIISVPVMAVMMLMAAKPAVMGQFVISRRLKILGWLATAMMGAAVVAMGFTL